MIETVSQLNKRLEDYDNAIYAELQLVLDEMSQKSKALASNLKECFDRIRETDRYLKAYRAEGVAIQEKDLSGEEFEIFRKYVRLLRSCTIMCGNDLSSRYKKLFIDFFMGKRVEISQSLNTALLDKAEIE